MGILKTTASSGISSSLSSYSASSSLCVFRRPACHDCLRAGPEKPEAPSVDPLLLRLEPDGDLDSVREL